MGESNCFILFFCTGTCKVTIVSFNGSEGHCKECYTSLQLQSRGVFQQNEKLQNALFTDSSRCGFKPLEYWTRAD